MHMEAMHPGGQAFEGRGEDHAIGRFGGRHAADGLGHALFVTQIEGNAHVGGGATAQGQQGKGGQLLFSRRSP